MTAPRDYHESRTGLAQKYLKPGPLGLHNSIVSPGKSVSSRWWHRKFICFLSMVFATGVQLAQADTVGVPLRAHFATVATIGLVVPANTVPSGFTVPADTVVAVPSGFTVPADTSLVSDEVSLHASDSLNIQTSETLRSRFIGLRNQWQRMKTFHSQHFDVYPMLIRPGNSETVLSDSTLRWAQWLEWSEFLAHQPGVISYRLGEFNRNDHHYIYGHGLRSQRVYLEGMSMQNAVTAQPHHAHISLERLARATTHPAGLTHRTDLEFQRYYTRRPLTRVHYQQASFELRSTEAQISHMLSRRQGIEFLYHGRNHAGEYRRSATDAREISARTFYHLSPRYMAQILFLYNGLQLQEPDGYNIPDPYSFGFNRFAAVPRQSAARSSVRNTQFQIALMRRAQTNNTSEGQPLATRQADTRILLHIDRYRRFYHATPDSSWLQYRSFNLAAQHHQHIGSLQMHYELRTSLYQNLNENRSSLNISYWTDARAELGGRFTPARLVNPAATGRIALPFEAIIVRRSDGYTGWEAGVGAILDLTGWLQMFTSAHTGEQMPTIQQLYWRGNLAGNENLPNSSLTRISAGLKARPSSSVHIDANAWIQQQDNLGVLRTDSVFSSLSGVGQWGAVVSARFENYRWDVQSSGTLMQYRTEADEFQAQLLNGSGLRLWSRSSVHWKGYLFSKATFARIGMYALVSPNAYRPARYLPVADYWDAALPEPEVPGFLRVDLDLSARVRSLMFLLRWENLTQGSITNGYFEHSRYPMPSRRLRFGLRVYFTD
jgi:hypothetical protein